MTASASDGWSNQLEYYSYKSFAELRFVFFLFVCKVRAIIVVCGIDSSNLMLLIPLCNFMIFK